MYNRVTVNNSSIPEPVASVTRTLHERGFDSYLVGGCIRDLMLGRTPKDWDVTTNATPEEIQSLFPETYYNNEFGTVGVVTDSEDPSLKVVEVTPYRLESEYSDARRPDSVTWGKTVEEDLSRRDFTINAIAYDPNKGHLVDPYNGQKDIKDKIIRAVGDPEERFAEDALRMLRAIRIGAELGFGIDQNTFSAIKNKAELLKMISKERIRDEFVRIIESDRPMEGILFMKQCGILPYVVPELEQAVGIDQNRSHVYTVFEHLLRSLQHAADKHWPLEIRLAALFHDISKPATRRFSRETGDYTFYGHEVVGSRETKKILERLKFPKKTVDTVSDLVRWHMFFSDPDKITLSAVRRMIRNVGPEKIWDLLNVRICDRIGSGRPKEQPFRFRKYKAMVEEALRDPVSVTMLNIDGKRLMDVSHETPGPKIGLTLHALLEEVLDDPSKNTSEYLESRGKELITLPIEELSQLGAQGRKRKEEAEKEELSEIHKKYGVA